MKSDIDRHFLKLALQEAEKALSENTYPVGAVIVDERNNIISKGRNRVHAQQDLTAHAEIGAIRNAGPLILEGKTQRKHFTIYTSLEPCPMCTGGLLFANIKRVVWINNDDEGFGGYRKLRDANIFDKRFHEVEVMEEPFHDLKVKQMALLDEWELNPNNIKNLRKSANVQ
nr:nucleoside deaminase [Falsibacillus pallidus]